MRAALGTGAILAPTLGCAPARPFIPGTGGAKRPAKPLAA